MSIFAYSVYGPEVQLTAPSIAGLPLDPIDCAGVIDAKVQARLAVFSPFSAAAFAMINDPSFFSSRLIDPASAESSPARNEWKKTKGVWKEHLLRLKEYHVVGTCPSPRLIVSSYFAVAKNNGEVARSIFGGRQLSLLFRRPPSVNLPLLPFVLSLAAEIVAEVGALYLLLADIRHYFHEIAVDRRLQPFFTVYCCSQLSMFLNLVMGWSYSPRIAQCYAWAALLSLANEHNGLEQAANATRNSEHPPSFVILHKRTHDGALLRVGLVFIWYDNFVCFVCCQDTAVALSQTLSSMSREFHFRWGSKSLTHPKDLRALANTTMSEVLEDPSSQLKNIAVAVGIQFGLATKRSRAGSHPQLVWRLKPKTVERAKEAGTLLRRAGLRPSCRLVAAVAGSCVWRNYIAREALACIHPVLDVSSRAGRHAREHSWCATISITPAEEEGMLAALDIVSRNDWALAQVAVGPDLVIAASDASPLRGAWTLLSSPVSRDRWSSWNWLTDADGSPVCREDGTELPSEEIIFLLELRAALKAIQELCPRQGTLVLLVDNTAGAASLRRGYSNHPVGRCLVEVAWRHMQAQQSFLLVVGIAGEDNDADSPTRGPKTRPLFSAHRLKISYETAVLALEGLDRRKQTLHGRNGSHSDDEKYLDVGFSPEECEADTADGRCDNIAEFVYTLQRETDFRRLS